MVVLNSVGDGVFYISSYKCVFDAIRWFAEQMGSEELDEDILLLPLSKIAIETGVSLFPSLLTIKEVDGKMTYSVEKLPADATPISTMRFS